ncbi:MAG: N-acetylmuramoyl-L-alanine amidase family protein [Clostridiales bacterium]|jgi:N-acetylmuramoyl-L-alanine amidase|nr:N-acetylmuramoyl-L-alanine amidase family protein [Clostridiales bacterium]
MKKIFSFIMIVGAIIFAPIFVNAEMQPVRLFVDGGEVLNMSAPPIILNDRTLVPVRDVFERVGGVVGWHSGHRQITLYYGSDVLIMTVDETSANLNGNIIEMDIPPIIHNDRTMVPLRFPSEVFGFDVDWDSDERAAIVNSNGNGDSDEVEADEDGEVFDLDASMIPSIPLPPEDEPSYNYETESDNAELPWDGALNSDELPAPGATVVQVNAQDLARDISSVPIPTISYAETTITTLQTPSETGTAAYMAVASSPITEVQYFLLPDNRLVVDIHNATSMISGNFDAPDNVPVSGVRASQFSQQPRVTRIVFDIVGAAEYSISLSADRTLLAISFSKNRINGIFSHSDAYSDTLFIQGDVLPAISISTEGFPNFITLNIANAEMAAVGGFFPGCVFASHFETGQNSDGSAYVRVYVGGNWPSFSIANSANSAAFMMHHGVSGVRYDSVNRELRISRNFFMDIHSVEQINDYLRYNYTFVLPASAEILGRGEVSTLDGFVNSITLSRQGENIHLTFNTARVLTFSVHEEPEYYVIRAHLPREIMPFIVVIDPGHGGSAPGASHNGIVEKDLVLSVSQMVMQLLNADPFITAYTTRTDDTFVSLLNRAEFANDIGADLFVSIHANAAELSRGVINPEVNGIETWYTLSERETFGNYNIDSLRFAQIMQRHQTQLTAAHNRGVRDAPDFVVLRETNMPSVLLEIGFLTNTDEAARLSSPLYQMQLAQAIYQGIVEAFATHTPAR